MQALSDPFHRKHNTVIGLLQIAESRRRGGTVSVVVPTSVRVVSGWNRSAQAAAAINRHRVHDHVLDRRTADVAASIRRLLGVSVADAHIGAAIREQQRTTRVITSDLRDIRLAAGDAPVIVIAI